MAAVSARARGRAPRRFRGGARGPGIGATLAAAAGLLLAGLLAAVWLVPPMLDWTRYRDSVAELASAGLGRAVTIDGPISLVLLPQPVLSAAKVTMADAGGASATVQEMRLQIGLAALLRGRVEVSELVLDGAAIRLPWPPGVTQYEPGTLQRGPPAWLTRLHARVEDSTLQVGGLSVTGIDGDVSADAITGALSANGHIALLGRRWRMGARLGPVGGNGSATLDVSIDGEGRSLDTGGTLSGRVAADGTLEGDVRGRGPDLSQLVTAPAIPWRASGRLSAGGGLAVASDLDLDLDGSPALGAVALRILPAVRVDAALSSSRLDLDAWLPLLLRGGGTALPTGVDLSAEQATLAGGTLRRLRAGFELTANGAVVREAEAILPGDAALHLSGQAAAGHFRGEARLDGSNVQQTLHWLRPSAPALIDALPAGVLNSVGLSARVDAGDGLIGLANLLGRVDGAAIAGDLAIHPGEHPALAATLAITGPSLDGWLPATLPATAAAWSDTLKALPRRWSGFDLDLGLTASQPTWRGRTLEEVTLETRISNGVWELRHAGVASADLKADTSFKLGDGGAVSDAQFSVAVKHAAALAPATSVLPDGLMQAPVTLRVTAAGQPGALTVGVAATIADARLEASGRADLAHSTWSGGISLRHPGAPRLLAALGFGGTVAWLGDGSLSLVAQAAVAPGEVSVKDADLSAGALRGALSLSLDTRGPVPALTGSIDAETLPLPLPYAGSPEPLPFSALQGWRAAVSLRAAHLLLGLSPALDTVRGDVAVQDGALRLTGLEAGLSGGHVAGSFTADSAGTGPPRLTLQAEGGGITLAGPVLDAVPDVARGRLDGTLSLSAAGYSPAALRATLSGQVTASVRDGALLGLDLPAAAAAAGQPEAALRAAAAAALAGGVTPFTRLDVTAAVQRGAITLQRAHLSAPSGGIDADGAIDLPAGDEDLRLSIVPDGGPRLDLGLIGPAADPGRTPGLSGITPFLATRAAR